MKKKSKQVSEFTKITWYLGVLAVITEIGIGFMYFTSIDSSERYFGIMTLIEGFTGFLGLLTIDVIHGKPFNFKPDLFRDNDPRTIGNTITIGVCLVVLQIILQFPLTVRIFYLASAILFAGVVEELFFRGFLLAVFIRMGENDKKLHIYKDYYISPTEIFGIFVSSLSFMVLHVNYYSDLTLMIMVFFSGVILGFFYCIFRDLTANILAHLGVNLIMVLQTFVFVNF